MDRCVAQCYSPAVTVNCSINKINLKIIKKFNFIILGVATALFIGLVVGYVLGSWRATTSSVSEAMVKISGKGTELIDTPTDPKGNIFNLVSQFEFSNEEFHCVLLPNERSFTVAAYKLGNVPIPEKALTMDMSSVRIDSVRLMANGSVEIKGLLKSITKVGNLLKEEAFVPFRTIARDGGPGYENDSLIVMVSYNEKDSPIQFAIFGPQPRFGAGRHILSGDITIEVK